MASKHKVILFLIFSWFIGCRTRSLDSYYCAKLKDNEVWRIPIIKPFELITVDTTTFWSLHWPKDSSNTYIKGFYNADSINFKDSQIIIVNKYGNISNHVIIDIKKERVYEFDTKEHLDDFKKGDTALHKLYSIKELFKNYNKSGSLPWSDQIPEYKPCK